MKKILLPVLLFITIGFLYADLDVDIPFDMNIVGDSYTAVGAYVYETEWITVTNTSSSSQDYTVEYSFQDLPANWAFSACNPQSCLIPNFPTPLPLDAGGSEQFHFVISVASTGGFPFNLTFDGGDLTEPISLDFTFNTEDNVSAEDQLVMQHKLAQNYPNPFNPETTIGYQVTDEEAQNSRIVIYNQKGQLVKAFTSLTTGKNSVIWQGEDNTDKPVASGIYFYRLEGSEQSDFKKMLLLR